MNSFTDLVTFLSHFFVFFIFFERIVGPFATNGVILSLNIPTLPSVEMEFSIAGTATCKSIVKILKGPRYGVLSLARQSCRLVTIETLIQFLTIENLNS